MHQKLYTNKYKFLCLSHFLSYMNYVNNCAFTFCLTNASNPWTCLEFWCLSNRCIKTLCMHWICLISLAEVNIQLSTNEQDNTVFNLNILDTNKWINWCFNTCTWIKQYSISIKALLLEWCKLKFFLCLLHVYNTEFQMGKSGLFLTPMLTLWGGDHLTVTYGGKLLYLWIWHDHWAPSLQIIVAACFTVR